MSGNGIMECIELITSELPALRDKLNITQRDFAAVIGISRQSIIDLEHQNRKITRSILISIVTFFSLKRETALLLYKKKLYEMDYVISIGYTVDVIRKIHNIGGE